MFVRFGKSALTTLGAVVFLTACGGGGGGGGGGPGPDPGKTVSCNGVNGGENASAAALYSGPTELVEITSENAKLVLAKVALYLRDPSGGPVGDLGLDPSNPPFLSGPSPVSKGSCPEGGTWQLDETRTEPGKESVGDVIAFSYDNCAFDLGQRVVWNGSGSATTKLASGERGVGDFSYEWDRKFRLEVSNAEACAVHHEEYSDAVAIADSGAIRETVTTRKASANDNGLYSGAFSSSRTDETLLTSIEHQLKCQPEVEECTRSTNFKLAMTVIGGSVEVETTDDFKMLDEQHDPTWGSLVIKGAGDTKITVEATGGGWVKVEHFNNGTPSKALDSPMEWFDLLFLDREI